MFKHNIIRTKYLVVICFITVRAIVRFPKETRIRKIVEMYPQEMPKMYQMYRIYRLSPTNFHKIITSPKTNTLLCIALTYENVEMKFRTN